jgi:hypothetical protein
MDSNNKKQFTCECGKKYIHQSGLLKHQKQCAKVSTACTTDTTATDVTQPNDNKPNIIVQEAEETKTTETKESQNTTNIGDRRFVMGLIQENQELKRIILKQHEQLENQDERLLEIVKAFFTKIITSVHQTQS